MPDRPQLSIVLLIGAALIVYVMRPTADGRHKNAQTFGAIPAAISQATREAAAGDVNLGVVRAWSRLATAIFIHADFEHLLLNMIMLWPFGTLVARRLGNLSAVSLALFTGIAGNIVQVMMNSESPIPIVGASGAITGLEGVYFGLLLRWNLPDPDVWPLAHPIPPLQLGAFAIVGFLYDIYSVMNHAQGIAYGAHLGGFVTGIAAAAVITTCYPTSRRWPF